MERCRGPACGIKTACVNHRLRTITCPNARSRIILWAMNLTLLLSLFFTASLMDTKAQTAAQFAEIWDKEHVTNILPSNVRHKDLQNYLDGLKKRGVKMDEVGRS